MALTYCFEKAYVKQALGKCKRSDFAVIDTTQALVLKN